MSNNETTGQVQAGDLSAAMKEFRSSLSAAEIDKSLRQVSSMQTMMFFFNPAGNINNLAGSKIRQATKYPILPRMTLIPVYPWKVPEIKARNASFSIMRYSAQGGATAGPSGVEVKQRIMLAHETRNYFEKWYGEIGAGFFDSLTTEEDIGKAEAFLLFEAIMKTSRSLDDEGKQRTTPGVEIVLEDLPKFLDNEAPLLLQNALAKGVEFSGSSFFPGFNSGFYRFTESRLPIVEEKGIGLISDLKTLVEKSHHYVLNEENGVLEVARNQLRAAEKGITGSKALLDRRDNFYLAQFPSFSMDTAVERAQRANSEVVSSIRESGRDQSETQTQLLKLIADSQRTNTDMLAELREERRKREELEARLAEVETPKAA